MGGRAINNSAITARQFDLCGAVDINTVAAALVRGSKFVLDATDQCGHRVRASFTPSAMTVIDGTTTRVSGTVRSGLDARLDFTVGQAGGAGVLVVGPDSETANRTGRRIADLRQSSEYIVVGIDLTEVVTALTKGDVAYAIVQPAVDQKSVLAMELRPIEICRPSASDWVAVRGTSGDTRRMNMIWSSGVGGWMRVSNDDEPVVDQG